ncbi:MAG: DinB family protein [Pedobacter sp.]|uniref:DinB family protein n=1 Tax=Pedobacter sp. TaxID=1411316 RepID=UPI003398A4A7
MSNDNRKFIVDELSALIEKGNAHASFEDAVKGISMDLIGVVPDRLPYGVWHMAEHLRITQWDILEFCLGPDHESPKWPDEYWPEVGREVSKETWDATISGFRKDRQRFLDLLKDESRDLYAPFAYGDGQSLFREALLLADHNSYHVGEIIVIRRLLGDWKSG